MLIFGINFQRKYFFFKGTIPLIVRNAFLECCKDNSVLVICGTFFIFEEVLKSFDIYSGTLHSILLEQYA